MRKMMMFAGAVLFVTLPVAGAEVVSNRTDELIAVLKSGAAYEQKAAACEDLAHSGGREAVPLLAGLLGDEKLAHMARYALEPMPDPAADAAFRAALANLKGPLLVGVINSIGVRRDNAAVDLLGKLLGDSDGQVAKAAAAALGRIGTGEAGKVLEGALDTAKGEDLQGLCGELISCADVLVSARKESRAIGMYEKVRKADVPVWLKAAGVRGEILCSGDASKLVELLNSNDQLMFAMGLRVAQELKGKKITSAIIFQLGRLPQEKVVQLIHILGMRADKTAAPELIALAQKGEKAVRLAAIGALAEIGDAAATPVLMALMKDSDSGIAQAAGVSLACLPDPDINDDVIKLLDSPDSEVRVRMLDLVGRRRIRAALPALVKAMDDGDEAVRFAAIRNYGAMAGAGELPALLGQLVKSTNAGEISALEKSLISICSGGVDQGEAGRKLAEGVAKANPESKQALLRVLRAAGGSDALKAVRAAVDDPGKDVHVTAVRLLSEWKTVDAVPVLLDLARNSKEEVDKVLSLRGYIGMIAKREVMPKAKLEMCRDAALLVQRDEEKKLLLGALRGIGSAESLDLVGRYLDDPGVKADAVSAVLEIARKRVKKQAAAEMKTALEKVVKVGAPDEVKAAEELLSKY